MTLGDDEMGLFYDVFSTGITNGVSYAGSFENGDENFTFLDHLGDFCDIVEA
jgi:hypothetical protein